MPTRPTILSQISTTKSKKWSGGDNCLAQKFNYNFMSENVRSPIDLIDSMDSMENKYNGVPHKGERYEENGVEVYWNLQEEDPSTNVFMERYLRGFSPEMQPEMRQRLEEQLTKFLEVSTLENGQVIAKWKVK